MNLRGNKSHGVKEGMPVIYRCFTTGLTAYPLGRLSVFEFEFPIVNTGM